MWDNSPAGWLIQEFERQRSFTPWNPSHRNLIDILDDDDMGEDHSDCGICLRRSSVNYLKMYSIKTWEIEKDRGRAHP